MSGRPRLEDLLGPLECGVLRALWKAAPATVAEVRERVNTAEGSALAHTTVMTVLGRLHDKQLVAREKRGRGHSYRPCYSEEDLVVALSRREVDRLVERYGDVALTAFASRLEQADPRLLERVQRLGRGSGT